MSPWYYTTDNRQRLGPVTADQLRQLALSGAVRPEHMVMREGGDKWVPAAKVKGLFPEPAASPLPLALPVRQAGGSRSKILYWLAGGLVAAGLLIGLGVLFGRRLNDRSEPEKASVANRGGTGKPGDKPVNPPSDEPGNKPPKKPAKEPEEKPAEKSADGTTKAVNAAELFAFYGNDVVAADKKYTGQVVELANVSGKVQKDSEGRYYLVAAEQARYVKRKEQGPRVMSFEEYQRRLQESALNTKYEPGIILYLDPKDAERFSGLGDKVVTVRGKCKGMTGDQRTQPGYFVTVERVCLVRVGSPEKHARFRDIQLMQNDFKQLGLAYHSFYDAKRRGPANVDELAPFFDNDIRLKQALQQGQYVFHWNLGLNQMPQGSSNTILAYERDPDAAGNRFVVMGDATPKIMGEADFEAALKAQAK
jgi:hypothetical protein